MSDMPPFIAAQLKAADHVMERALILLGEAAGWCGTKHPRHPLATCVLQPHDEATYHRAVAPELGGAVVEWRATAYIHPHEVESDAVDPDDEHDRAKESADRWEPGDSHE